LGSVGFRVTIVPEFSVSTPDGRRMMPEYVVEEWRPTCCGNEVGCQCKFMCTQLGNR